MRVLFTIGAGGKVVGDVASEDPRRPQRRLASRRGQPRRQRRPGYAAAPYRNLPREFYGEKISVNFNAREACS